MFSQRKMLAFVGLGLAASISEANLLMAASTLETPGARTGSISGLVVDGEGKPLAGVLVQFTQYSRTQNLQSEAVATNDQGEFTLPEAPVGPVMVLAKTTGKHSLSGGVSTAVTDRAVTKLAGPIALSGANRDPRMRP
jgi:hypothetical protein